MLERTVIMYFRRDWEKCIFVELYSMLFGNVQFWTTYTEYLEMLKISEQIVPLDIVAFFN